MIITQIENQHFNINNREAYIEDLKQSEVSLVLLSFCDVFADGEDRIKECGYPFE